MKRSSTRGFTVIELMIVLAILGIIVAVLSGTGLIKFGPPHQRCRDEAGNDLQRYEQCVRREDDD